MMETPSRHDRLAVRLTQIISRLLSGESLCLKALKEEFGVSERTLQRDFHQRLIHLNLTCENGRWKLAGKRFSDSSLDVLAFMRNIGITPLFPSADRRLMHWLVGDTPHSPCIVWPSCRSLTAVSPTCFHRLIQAICQQRCIQVLIGKQTHDNLEPYRLIHTEGCWYLVVCQAESVQVFPAASISMVTLTAASFIRQDKVCDLTTGEQFIDALPHFPFIQDVLRTVTHRPYLRNTLYRIPKKQIA